MHRASLQRMPYSMQQRAHITVLPDVKVRYAQDSGSERNERNEHMRVDRIRVGLSTSRRRGVICACRAAVSGSIQLVRHARRDYFSEAENDEKWPSVTNSSVELVDGPVSVSASSPLLM